MHPRRILHSQNTLKLYIFILFLLLMFFWNWIEHIYVSPGPAINMFKLSDLYWHQCVECFISFRRLCCELGGLLFSLILHVPTCLFLETWCTSDPSSRPHLLNSMNSLMHVRIVLRCLLVSAGGSLCLSNSLFFPCKGHHQPSRRFQECPDSPTAMHFYGGRTHQACSVPGCYWWVNVHWIQRYTWEKSRVYLWWFRDVLSVATHWCCSYWPLYDNVAFKNPFNSINKPSSEFIFLSVAEDQFHVWNHWSLVYKVLKWILWLPCRALSQEALFNNFIIF